MNDIATVERALKDADQVIGKLSRGESEILLDSKGTWLDISGTRDRITTALMILRKQPALEVALSSRSAQPRTDGDDLEPGELRRCPFCAGEAERYDADETSEGNEGGSAIQCKSCKATTALHFDRKENLLSSWNDRIASLGADADDIWREAYLRGADNMRRQTASWVQDHRNFPPDNRLFECPDEQASAIRELELPDVPASLPPSGAQPPADVDLNTQNLLGVCRQRNAAYELLDLAWEAMGFDLLAEPRPADKRFVEVVAERCRPPSGAHVTREQIATIIWETTGLGYDLPMVKRAADRILDLIGGKRT